MVEDEYVRGDEGRTESGMPGAAEVLRRNPRLLETRAERLGRETAEWHQAQKDATGEDYRLFAVGDSVLYRVTRDAAGTFVGEIVYAAAGSPTPTEQAAIDGVLARLLTGWQTEAPRGRRA